MQDKILFVLLLLIQASIAIDLMKNRTITLHYNTQMNIGYGKLQRTVSFIWQENSTLPIYFLLQLFYMKHEFIGDNLVGQFYLALKSRIENNEYDKTDDMAKINNLVNSDMVQESFTYIHSEDGKQYVYSFEYNRNLPYKLYIQNLTSHLSTVTMNLQQIYNSNVHKVVYERYLYCVFLRGINDYTFGLPEKTLAADLQYKRYNLLADVKIANPGYIKYLEIGTFENELFVPMQNLFQYAVGVDPEQGGTHRMTSDEYFESNYSNDMFDVVFIDGLHEAFQTYRDILNALHVLRPGGMILVHDCNPPGQFIITLAVNRF